MTEIMSVKEVRQLEARAAEYGLNEDVLIENAAAALKEAVLSHTSPQDKICILAGGGNNGADGLSLARMLYLAGRKVTVLLTSDKFGRFAEARLKACRALGVPECDACDFDPDGYAAVVDAMLGTGCDRPLEGKLRDTVLKLNNSRVFTLAVDIPTGLNADTGETELAVVADETVTFSCMKFGQALGVGRNYCGNILVKDIGLRGSGAARIVTAEDAQLPARTPVGHKYDYGKVRVIAGSPEMIGAALLAHESALSALRCGAGLCNLCVPSSLRAAYQQRVKEETLTFMPDRDGKIIFDTRILDEITVKTRAILIGPGMGTNPELLKIIEYLKDTFDGTLVIDADGLNALAGNMEILKSHKAKIILTPHMGEFERLCKGESIEAIPLAERVKTLAHRYGAVIAAKSATTVISDGNSVYLNTTGTPALAKGGSGDVLGGMIAAFACRLDPLHATLAGCYHFGKTAEEVEKVWGRESLLASDIRI